MAYALIKEINKETVDFQFNFDGSLQERCSWRTAYRVTSEIFSKVCQNQACISASPVYQKGVDQEANWTKKKRQVMLWLQEIYSC